MIIMECSDEIYVFSDQFGYLKVRYTYNMSIGYIIIR